MFHRFILFMSSHVFPFARIVVEGVCGFVAASRYLENRKANKARHINRRGRFV
jgi:hypothetical protein